MARKKRFHFVGIKGVGMAPLALIAKEAGHIVSGCDVEAEFITDTMLKRAGIEPFTNFSPIHLENIDIVITTGAHGGLNNPEVVEAKNRGIHVMTQGEAVGEFMKGEILGKKDLVGISVAGTHGKTTTTAMLATVLQKLGAHPSYLIGTSYVSSLGNPGKFGKGKYFVAEADEYATEPTYDKTPKFLWQHPTIAIVTSIELDHPDVYDSIDSMRLAYVRFIENIARHGVLIACGDDEQIRILLKDVPRRRVMTYGFSPTCDFVIKKSTVSGTQTFFWVETKGSTLGEFSIQIPGDHNALNALSVIIAAQEIGFSVDQIKKAIKLFTGSKRRFEFVGELVSGTLVYDDYAHHPTEIEKTLAACKKMFPRKKIVCIFQPHTFTRTKVLFDGFVRAFASADTLVLTDIYPSLRESPDSTVSSEYLAKEIAKGRRNVFYYPTTNDVLTFIENQRFSDDAVLITMGAGDIYKLSDGLHFVDR